ncbi:hypothetical protein KSP40_PGU007345 [Platanthera guangdongensis]|uniref:Uncharacterized protein n=1 Tax=Platanthera guangdongensis TaxID=2320717 RepID=A0ABR2M8J2_9ASPA
MTDVHGVIVELAKLAGLLDKLYELCCVEGSSNASIATKNGGVELLTSLCDFLHGRSSKPLVSALSSIIHDVQITHTFRQSDGPKIVVDILKDGFQSVAVLENGFSVIAAASTANEVLNESFMDLKLDEILVKMARGRGCEIDRSWSYRRGFLGMLLAKTEKKVAFSYNLQLMMDECKTFTDHETLVLRPFSSM